MYINSQMEFEQIEKERINEKINKTINEEMEKLGEYYEVFVKRLNREVERLNKFYTGELRAWGLIDSEHIAEFIKLKMPPQADPSILQFRPYTSPSIERFAKTTIASNHYWVPTAQQVSSSTEYKEPAPQPLTQPYTPKKKKRKEREIIII